MTESGLMGNRAKAPLIAGTLAVLLVFGMSRWGTYLGVHPLYLTDLLLALAFLHWRAGTASPLGGRRPSSGMAVFAVIVAWASLRLLLSETYDLTALRDAVPYLYAAVGVLAGWSYSESGAASRTRTAKWLTLALCLHLVWAIPALMSRGTLAGPALSGTAYVFQIRSDIDAALASILAGYCVLAVLLHRRRRLAHLLLLGVALYLVFTVPNRSALLCLGAAVTLAIFAYLSARHVRTGKAVMLTLLPAASAFTFVWLPMTTNGARMMATFGVAQTSETINAQGTFRAREMAWSELLHYWTAETGRLLFGVGFGPNFLSETGADVLLGSETFGEGVRSPHNYLIGTALRLGAIGVVLTLVLLGVCFVSVLRIRHRLSQESLLLISALTVAALTPAAMVGVVFEAPFGAVPFFWASGILISAARAERRTAEAEAADAVRSARIPA